jgi:hypothetical protein
MIEWSFTNTLSFRIPLFACLSKHTVRNLIIQLSGEMGNAPDDALTLH